MLLFHWKKKTKLKIPNSKPLPMLWFRMTSEYVETFVFYAVIRRFRLTFACLRMLRVCVVLKVRPCTRLAAFGCSLSVLTRLRLFSRHFPTIPGRTRCFRHRRHTKIIGNHRPDLTPAVERPKARARFFVRPVR